MVMLFLFISVTNFFLFIQLEKLVSKNYFLHMSAKEAYKAYIRAYDSHHLKTIFDVHTLDLARVAQSFGFKVPPTVDLSMFNLICWH
jgi:ATP-dependent RNA helicase DDX18/HAS1